MEEILRHAIIKLRGMWHYRWLGLAVAWIVAISGFVGISFVPDRYEASARIYVNTASILKPLMSGLTVLPNDEQQISMLSRVIISRPNVEKLIQATGLDAEAKSKPEYERIVDGVIKNLNIQSVGKDNVYNLTFRDVLPDRATRVVQQFASLFIESGHGRKSDDTDAAKRFIDEQIATYEKKLQEAESRLKEFKLRALDKGTGQGDYFARIAETSSLLEKSQLELREAENTRDALRRGLASEEPIVGAGSPAPSVTGSMIADVEARIDAQKRSLDVLLQKYTDRHPDVIGAQRVIRELEEQRIQLLAARRREGPASYATLSSGGGARAAEQLKVSLAQAEGMVASLRARVAEYSGRYAKLKAAASLVPQLEAEATQLNRDYEVNKKNYDSLVARRESANISGEMQSVSGIADFRIIDPPRVSPGPVFPSRRILFPLLILAALASGFAAAFGMRELRPAFYDGRSLAEVTGLPILGAISLVEDDARKKAAKRTKARFLAAVGLMLGSYLAGFLALAFLSARAG